MQRSSLATNDPQTGSFVRYIVLLSTLLLLQMSCDKVRFWQPPPANAACNPWKHPSVGPLLRQQIAAGATTYQRQGSIGCLVRSRGSQAETKLVVLGENGGLLTWQNDRFAVPTEPITFSNNEDNGPTRFQFYGLRGEQLALLSLLSLPGGGGSLGQVQSTLCGALTADAYKLCLSSTKTCLFMLEFQPVTEGLTTPPLSPATTEVNRTPDTNAKGCALYAAINRTSGEVQPDETTKEPPPDKLLVDAPNNEVPGDDNPGEEPEKQREHPNDTTDASSNDSPREPQPEKKADTSVTPNPACATNCAYQLSGGPLSAITNTQQLAGRADGKGFTICGRESCLAYVLNASSQYVVAGLIKPPRAATPPRVSWAPNHDLLALWLGGTLQIGNVAQLSTSGPFLFRQGSPAYKGAKFTRDGKRLYTLNINLKAQINVWNLATPSGPVTNPNNPITFGNTTSTSSHIAVHPTQPLIAVDQIIPTGNPSKDWFISFYKEQGGTFTTQTNFKTLYPITTMAFHPSGKYLVVSLPPPEFYAIPFPPPSNGNAIGIPPKSKPLLGPIQEIRFSRNGELMSTIEYSMGAKQREVRFWRYNPNAATGKSPFTEIGSFPEPGKTDRREWLSLLFGRSCHHPITIELNNGKATLQEWMCRP